MADKRKLTDEQIDAFLETNNRALQGNQYDNEMQSLLDNSNRYQAHLKGESHHHHHSSGDESSDGKKRRKHRHKKSRTKITMKSSNDIRKQLHNVIEDYLNWDPNFHYLNYGYNEKELSNRQRFFVYRKREKKKRQAFTDAHPKLFKVIAIMLCVAVLGICASIGRVYDFSVNNTEYLKVPEAVNDMDANFSFLSLTELDQSTTSDEYIYLNLDDYTDTCEITTGGDYYLTGSLDGTLNITVSESDVHLFLDNINITSTTGSALYCDGPDKLIITSLENTNNTISDSGDYRNEMNTEDSCIYSDCDIAFNGKGTLNVYGYYKDAIQSKDIVKIVDGNYSIKCKRIGIMANDGFYQHSGKIEISSEKHGIKTVKKGDEGRGNIMIGGGELSIIAGRYAFIAQKADLYIYNTKCSLRSLVSDYNVKGSQYVDEECVN